MQVSKRDVCMCCSCGENPSVVPAAFSTKSTFLRVARKSLCCPLTAPFLPPGSHPAQRADPFPRSVGQGRGRPRQTTPHHGRESSASVVLSVFGPSADVQAGRACEPREASLRLAWSDGSSLLCACGLPHLPAVSGLLSQNYQVKNLNPN